METKLKRLLDAKQAANYLSISRSYIYQLVEENKLYSIKIGSRRLFDIIDLDAFVEKLKMSNS